MNEHVVNQWAEASKSRLEPMRSNRRTRASWLQDSGGVGIHIYWLSSCYQSWHEPFELTSSQTDSR